MILSTIEKRTRLLIRKLIYNSLAKTLLSLIYWVDKYHKVVVLQFPSCSIGRSLAVFREFFSEMEATYDREPLILACFDRNIANHFLASFIKTRVYKVPTRIGEALLSVLNEDQANTILYRERRGHFYPFSGRTSKVIDKEFARFVSDAALDFPSGVLKVPYVALCVREEPEDSKESDDNFYRNSRFVDWQNYVEEVAQIHGVNFVRMGRYSRTTFESQFLFDYSQSMIKSDANDFVIFQNCEFAISTVTGLDSFASHLFRKPVLALNAPLMGTDLSLTRRFMLPKILVSRDSGRVISVDQILDQHLFSAESTSEFFKLGILLYDNPTSISVQATSDFVKNNYFIKELPQNLFCDEGKMLSKARLQYLQSQFSIHDLKRSEGQDLELVMTQFPSYWPNIRNVGLEIQELY